MRKRESISIELPSKSMAKLKARAQAEGMTPSAVATQVIEQSLEKEQVSVAEKLSSLKGIIRTRAGRKNGTRDYLKGFGE